MEDITFEEALLKLEDKIRNLEKGEIPLDDMVKEYEETSKLVKFCSQKLENANKTVNKILNPDGSLSDFNRVE